MQKGPSWKPASARTLTSTLRLIPTSVRRLSACPRCAPPPPFYASVKNCGLTLATIDGITVNHDLQPVMADGTVIEGVRVVGNDQGGFYAGTYPNLAAGLNAGRCATFGRMAGKALATA